MLTITIPEREFFDNVKQEFITAKKVVLQLEHSLISLSKWESKWKVPFLEKLPLKTNEQTIDYIRCMTISQNIDPEVYDTLPTDIFPKISDYIIDPMTATWFSEPLKNKAGTKIKPEVLTSEVLYYKMISYNIPMECQKWHLNRLVTLIRVFNLKNEDPKKRNKKEMMAERQRLNEQRRSNNQSKG